MLASLAAVFFRSTIHNVVYLCRARVRYLAYSHTQKAKKHYQNQHPPQATLEDELPPCQHEVDLPDDFCYSRRPTRRVSRIEIRQSVNFFDCRDIEAFVVPIVAYKRIAIAEFGKWPNAPALFDRDQYVASVFGSNDDT